MTREPDSYYEPDAEDFASMIAEEQEIASLRSEYHEAARELRNYGAHTDRQLRGLSKKRKASKRILRRRHHFDVVSDDMEVWIGGDVYDYVSYSDISGQEDETVSDEDPRDLTRKGKRRAKTERRKAERERNLRIWRTQREKSQATSVVRKTGAQQPAVAALWHA